ncbi:MAG: sulfatase-like hydrolase/transferase [Promethearchaeota archaeon]
MKSPNIIFILTDQQRFDSLGCYGQNLKVSPNIDKMAAEGVQFKYAFSNQPVCGPARSILQTGKYATETRCYRNGIALPINEETLAKYFSQAGYEVGYLGKWHLASTSGRSKDIKLERVKNMTTPIPEQYRGGYKDYWLASDLLEFTSNAFDGHLFDKDDNQIDFNGYRVDCMTDFALEYLSKRDNSKPLFFFISFLEPHQQNDQDAIIGPKGSKLKFKNYDVPGDLQGMKGDWKNFYPDYLGCCNNIDHNVGRIINKIKDLNMEENTILIFTSDHGCHFRTRNSEYKRSCHDASIRIPLIINGRGFKGGKQINELVSLIDLPPTLLECAEIPIPNHMKGKILQQILNGNSQNWLNDVFIQISETQVGRSIRTQKWKYSVEAPDKDGILYSRSEMYEETFLYDLENDAHEKQNLIAKPEFMDVRKELSSLLKQRMIEAGESAPIIIPQDSYI